MQSEKNEVNLFKPIIDERSHRNEMKQEQAAPTKVEVRDVDLYYGHAHILKKITMDIPDNSIVAFIGPSGCGKSSFLRCLNRMNDRIPSARVHGKLLMNGVDLYDRRIDVVELRKRVGMVFQKPNPFPMSVFDNIASGLRLHKMHRNDTADWVEETLQAAALWDEVKDKLKSSALELSGGQQQRLCIARALAIEPEVLLMDEPTSALDPISTGLIEELMIEMKKRYTIVLVTHNMFQASRVSDITGFFLNGDLVEMGPTQELFTNPKDKRTEDYITGRFG